MRDFPPDFPHGESRDFRAELDRFPRSRFERVCGVVGAALLIAGLVGIAVLVVVAGAVSFR
jgi:hypothetical protein